jgi:CPA1 family monovalent cation:H+ antiporter
MFSLFDIIAILLALTASFAWVNHVLLGLPNTIGLLLMGLVASLVLVAVELLFPGTAAFDEANRLVREIHLSGPLLNGMLGFLLFAGALHVDFSKLRERKWIVGVMATFGVFISTLVIGIGFWVTALWLGAPIAFAWALVFGALISPTDPVAVLTTLKGVKLPETLEMDISGESLFNDGVGVVLFTILLAAASSGGSHFGLAKFAQLFLVEALGGALLGLAAGYVAYRAMRLIDDYTIEVLITLALVTATYAAALRLHVSGPIAVVTAGVLIGNRGTAFAMSETTRRYVYGFWSLVDEILNSVLFLLIGLVVLVLEFTPAFLPLGFAAIPIVLVARLCAVSIPVLALRRNTHFEKNTIAILTWAGVRGGISIALALSIVDAPDRSLLLTATYIVAMFSIVVQGLSLRPVIQRLRF